MNLDNLTDIELSNLRESVWIKIKPFIKNQIINDEYLSLDAQLAEIDWAIMDRYKITEE